MSFVSPFRGVQGIVGRHVAMAQSQQTLPAIAYVRRTFALAHQRQRKQSIVAAAAVASPSIRTRTASTSAKAPTTVLSQSEAMKLLNEQRSLRPSSPHFTIYEPQLTWIGSIANRVTGVGLSALLYVWAVSYLALPYTPIGEVLSSAHMVHYAALAPFWLKLTLKAPLAAAASYHTWNGFRHLAWDMGYFLSMKGVYASGYTVIGLSVLSTVGLCML